MALRYKINPLSFQLPAGLHKRLFVDIPRDFDENIGGYAVHFSASSARDYKRRSVRSVATTDFWVQFTEWVAGLPSGERIAAMDYAKAKQLTGRYSKVNEDSRDASGHERRRSESDRADSTGRFSGTTSDAQSTSAQNEAKYSASSAKETSDAARALGSTGGSLPSRSFDLSSLQYKVPLKEKHVPVSRGSYKGVLRDIVFGQNGGYLITGPTGCGKSTVALLYLFFKPGSTVLVVEPTQANAANIYHEFKHILPVLAKRINAPAVPQVSFIAPAVARPPYTRLMVTTTEKYLEYFQYYGKVFSVDYVVIDEFHLPIPSMVKMVELVRAVELAPKYILVSATAVGVKVEASLPPAVTCVTGRLEVGKIPNPVVGSDLDPRRWSRRGDGSFGVVAPSVGVAKELHKLYCSWGCRAYLITRETYVSDYVKAVTDYRPFVVYSLEPGVEAGVTLSMAVLASMGATTAIRYDGRVVVEDTQPLDSVSGVQRGGRGGRVVPTLYIQPPAPTEAPPESSALYYRAQAMVWLRSFGVDVTRLEDNGLFSVFPRVKTVSVELARACLATGGDPFVAVYKHNNKGVVYTECGGTGEGFMELAKTELFLYHWAGGFFVAPIADFSVTTSQPASFVVREHQLRAAQAMVESVPGLSGKFTLDRLVDLVIQKLDVYLNDLFDVLSSVFSGSSPTEFFLGSKPPEIEDFVKESSEVTKLFTYLTTEPNGVRYHRVVGTGDRPGAKHSFSAGSKVLNFSFSPKYMNEGKVNVAKVSEDVFGLLKRVLAVEVLMNGAPDRCVNLANYTERVGNDHSWFNTTVRRGRV